MTDLLVALGLALALEGTLYALAPDAMKTMMRRVLDLPEQTLRATGLAALCAGVFLVWMIRG
ncbi:DUF2065 family protein [Microvirga tunisiensis]|uniref:DUF2065 family protein n=2 Tax=Pannonibacter tanglangensis TaxID=2750084 RepID=A0A7X5EZL6_9HYPH|nr:MULTISPECIES: DUF2065 domain-containing protein [unclassified Pannonibacter]NBN63401.1 DUF2065 family protein [Pannonibacter sp. XCT-34]NBN77036.1 DUF2065 family protein [Pannonibacter sp. XCT-53]